jgi:hypothetical protein
VACGRHGHYNVDRLLEKLGRHARLTDFLRELARDCPRKLNPVSCAPAAL